MSRPAEWREFDAESRRAGVRVVLWVLVAVLVVGAISAGVWGFRVATANVRGQGNVALKTKGNADYRMAAYDHFYRLCGQIQATEDRIGLAQQQVKLAPNVGRKRQLQANVLALQNVRVELIRQYNADASEGHTRGQFRASDLPYSINVNQEHTTCAR